MRRLRAPYRAAAAWALKSAISILEAPSFGGRRVDDHTREFVISRWQPDISLYRFDLAFDVVRICKWRIGVGQVPESDRGAGCGADGRARCRSSIRHMSFEEKRPVPTNHLELMLAIAAISYCVLSDS